MVEKDPKGPLSSENQAIIAQLIPRCTAFKQLLEENVLPIHALLKSLDLDNISHNIHDVQIMLNGVHLINLELSKLQVYYDIVFQPDSNSAEAASESILSKSIEIKHKILKEEEQKIHNEIAKLLTQQKNLKSEMDFMKQKITKKKEKYKNVQEKVEECKSRSRKIISDYEKTSKKLNKEIKDQTEERNKLQEELKRIQEHNKDHVDTPGIAYYNLEKDINSLKEQIEASNKEKASLKQTIDSKTIEFQELNTRFESTKKQLSELKEKFKRYEESQENIEEKINQHIALKMKIEEINTQIIAKGKEFERVCQAVETLRNKYPVFAVVPHLLNEENKNDSIEIDSKRCRSCLNEGKPIKLVLLCGHGICSECALKNALELLEYYCFSICQIYYNITFL